jgi:hypothetical protein
MKTFKKIIYCSIILFFTISCKKDDLPAASQEGKDIMAAKVNGNVWVKTACFSCIGAGGGLSVSYSNKFINIQGEKFVSKNDDSVIGLELFASKTGEYLTNGVEAFITYDDFGNKKYYRTTSNSTGIINITKIDPVNKIISGTFICKVENENDPTDIISITDGRFDVSYN